MSQSIALSSADNIRILSAAMVEKAGSGHPGGAMGGADFIQILYSEFLNFDPDDGSWPFRDRMFLDPGHMSAMLYAQLTLCNFLSLDDLKNFRQWKSPTPGHPEVDISRGIENTSGPLGLGHAFGAGAAIAERFLVERFGEWMSHYTYMYISDGGIQEEISQGVGRIAGFLGLGKIIMFYDSNNVQLSTKVGEVMSEDTAKKYESWHWHVMTINGNDENEVRHAIRTCQSVEDKPSLIIGNTIMGKGAVKEDGSPYEGQVETHGKPLGKSKASFPKTISNLGGNAEDPFVIFPQVADYYAEVLDSKRKYVKKQREIYANWQINNPEKAVTLTMYLDGILPSLDFSKINLTPNDATRNASSKVLAYLAEQVGNMIVASADLSNSDMTDGFLKKTTAFTKGNFSGAFMQAGVSELTMAALSTGMALHGGVIPVCATFFAFSDYMKPVLRVASLMEQPVKFVWTHDAFRVGEDGPTHQPIEQEAQLRLLEKLHNHSGIPSFVALRPADSAETAKAWELLLHTKDRPGGLILSRQNIKDLPPKSEDRFSDSAGLSKGAYIVYETSEDADVILLANGSEVSTLIDAAVLIESRTHYRVRVVSVPSEGIFRQQPTHYQHSVLPDGIPVFGLTAGLPVTLEGMIKDNGRVYGMTHFGYSAPYTVLDEKFGYTAENMVKHVKGGGKFPFLFCLTMQQSEVDKLVEKGLSELGFDDTYLIETKVKVNKIEIFLDSDEGVNFLKCQKISRWLEAIFDEKKTFGETYILDVSSAGVGSPLKLLRQYPKNIGRTIEIKYGEGKSVRGILKSVVDHLISVEYESIDKEGKKNKKVRLTEEIKFEDIIESKIKISFN